MAKKSQTVKEIVQIVVFLAVVALVVMVFLVYPLNRVKAFVGRADIDQYNPDSLALAANDASLFEEAGMVADTFRVEADGLTTLACLYLTCKIDSTTETRISEPEGIAVLLSDEKSDRNSMIPLAKLLTDSGFVVIVYDQRASGLSSGSYHSDGQYEATDFQELARYLAFRGQLNHPFVAVGVSSGADALLIASREEKRLDAIVVVEPYLSAEHWMNILMDEHDMYWIPFKHTLFQFWYELRSDYAFDYTTTDDIKAVTCPTLLLASEQSLQSDEFNKLTELSSDSLLQTEIIDSTSDGWIEKVANYLMLQKVESPQ